MELEDRGDDFAPENPIVDTRLGGEAADGVAFEESGVRIRPLGRDQEDLADILDQPAEGDADAERTAVRKSEELELEPPKSRAMKPEGKLLYPEVEADTDLVLAPLPTGVEVLWSLRSKESPEEQVLELDMPKDADLRLADDEDGAEDSAKVVRDGETLLTIAPPVAYDATGKQIPASYEVDDERLIVKVPHRAEDILYPALVDPVIEEQKDWETNSSTGFQGWRFQAYGDLPGWSGDFSHFQYGRGLTIVAPAGTWNNGDAAFAGYQAPGMRSSTGASSTTPTTSLRRAPPDRAQ